MTEFKIEKITIDSANFNGESSLPPIITKLSLSDINNSLKLDENDGLFINYGGVECAYPYRYQDMYDRELLPKEYESVVLENDFLKATFMPCFGGKLWSLFDKTHGRELLFKNDVVRPCNLGVRNAWLSGGIEWNVSFRGHGPFTCSLINTAKFFLEDGTPALRFYYYERIRCVVVQMDFFLPDNSQYLYARTRITNPNSYVVPMYWWSNVGVVEEDMSRVIVPAEESYTAHDNDVIKVKIPVYNGTDVTYPNKINSSNDFFWITNKGQRKYICQLDKDGYGLAQTSTSFLKGRKLFVWGNSQGGHKWRNFLTADDKTGSYDEIQCGISHTQYECEPMPPYTIWEWVEAYGAMKADPLKIHGDWKAARSEVEKIIDATITQETLDKLLEETRKVAKSPAKELIYLNDGWGALELMLRQRTGGTLMNDHLDFGNITEEQKDWLKLIEEGTIGEHNPNDIPISYNRQQEWLELLEKATKEKDSNNWYAYYLLGTAAIANEEYSKAQVFLEKSLSINSGPWANYAYSVMLKKSGQAGEVEYMLKAYSQRKGDLSLFKEVLRCLFDFSLSNESIDFFENETEEIQQNKRCLLYYAFALARQGMLDKAEEILCGKNGPLIVPDIRECELSLSDLWFFIQEKRGVKIPKQPIRDLDFRMFTKREGWLKND